MSHFRRKVAPISRGRRRATACGAVLTFDIMSSMSRMTSNHICNNRQGTELWIPLYSKQTAHLHCLNCLVHGSLCSLARTARKLLRRDKLGIISEEQRWECLAAGSLILWRWKPSRQTQRPATSAHGSVLKVFERDLVSSTAV